MYFFAYVFFDLLFVPRHSLLMSTLLPLHFSKLSPWDGNPLPPFLRVCSNKSRRCATLVQSMAHGVSMFFISPTLHTILHFDSPLDLVPADCVAFQSIVSFHQHNLFEEVLRHQSKQTQHNRVFCFHLIMLVQYMFHMDKYIVFTSFHIFGSTTSEWASCMDEFETISKAVSLCPNILANHLRYAPRDVTPKR